MLNPRERNYLTTKYIYRNIIHCLSQKKALSELLFCETGFEGMLPSTASFKSSQLAVEGGFFWTPSWLKATYVSLLPFLWLCYSHFSWYFLDTSWRYGGEEEKEAELLGLLLFRSCLLNYLLMGCDDQEVCNYYSNIPDICHFFDTGKIFGE